MAFRLSIRSAPETPAVTTSVAGSERDAEIVYSFDQERVVIGRGAGADVRLPHRSVSSQHALLTVVQDQHAVIDSGSTNGTYVNGNAVARDRPKTLRDGDLLTTGGYILAFHTGRTAAPIITAERTAELAKHMLRRPRGAGVPVVSQPRIVVLNGPHTGTSLLVPEPPVRLLVGRSETCQLQLTDANISREHMEVTRDLEGVVVRNLDSENGVRWGDHAVHERRLRDGDELMLGATRLLFEDPADELLRSIASEPDMHAPPPPLPVEPVQPTPVSPAPTAAGVVAPSRRPARRAPSMADMVIYVFAAAMLALSVAGIVALLRPD